MIKKCRVLSQNISNMIVLYDDTKIQFKFKENNGYVFVKFDNKKYSIVTEEEYLDFTNTEVPEGKSDDVKEIVIPTSKTKKKK